MNKLYVRPGRHTLRLAVTYLAVMMAMSLVFSVALYATSASKLHTSTRTRLLPPINQGDGQAPNTVMPPTIVSSDEQFSAVKKDLIQALIVLNVTVALLGAGLSWYLARRTLLPIERALEAQERFAADASHELRTPLTIMQGEVEMALRARQFSPQRAKAALESNLQEIKKLRQLSEALLQLTQTSRRAPFTAVSAAEIVNRALDSMAAAAKAKHITVTSQVPELPVLGDAVSLQRVMCILLDNAIKYSPPHGDVRITGYAEAKNVYLRVQDNGMGIALQDLPHIFDRFYRADSPETRAKPKGYGLGLSIAQNIMQQHCGGITVTSTAGKGTTFTVRIPRPV